MNAVIPRLILILTVLITAGCASQKATREPHSYRFESRRSSSQAPVLRQREVSTDLELDSDPEGASVYVYDFSTGKGGSVIGKTPCRYRIITFHITEYADMTVSYWVEIPILHRITKPVDFSDPENHYGEITFAFLFAKEGYAPQIERLPVKATNDVLVQALATNRVPDYAISVTLSD